MPVPVSVTRMSTCLRATSTGYVDVLYLRRSQRAPAVLGQVQ